MATSEEIQMSALPGSVAPKVEPEANGRTVSLPGSVVSSTTADAGKLNRATPKLDLPTNSEVDSGAGITTQTASADTTGRQGVPAVSPRNENTDDPEFIHRLAKSLGHMERVNTLADLESNVETWYVDGEGTTAEESILLQNQKREFRSSLNVFSHEDFQALAEHSVEHPKLMLNGVGRTRRMWDVVIIVLLVYCIFMVPWALAFDQSNLDELDPNLIDVQPEMDALFWVNLMVDIIFLIDIVLNFRTSMIIVDPETASVQIETRGRVIAKKYLTTWFLPDLIGSMPIEGITINLTTTQYARIARVPRLFKLFRLMRLLKLMRLGRLDRYMSKIKDYMKINPGVFRIARFAAVFCIVAHIMSCALFFCGTLDYRDSNGVHMTWVTETYINVAMDSDGTNNPGRVPVRDAPLSSRYLLSLYWAITTMTTVGYGDVLPITTAEVFVCVINMIIGASVFSFIVGNMANLISRLDGRSAAFRAKKEAINQFMHDYRLPRHLQKRVNEYMAYTFSKPAFSPHDEVVSGLSMSLRVDLAKHLYRDLLLKVPLFRVANENFVDAVVLCLTPLQVSPGDVIMKVGDPCSCMFFVVHGEVEVRVPQQKKAVASFFPGNFFGEHMVVGGESGKANAPFTCIARTWVHLYTLRRRDLDRILTSFPTVKTYIEKVARERSIRLSKVSKAWRALKAIHAFKWASQPTAATTASPSSIENVPIQSAREHSADHDVSPSAAGGATAAASVAAAELAGDMASGMASPVPIAANGTEGEPFNAAGRSSSIGSSPGASNNAIMHTLMTMQQQLVKIENRLDAIDTKK